MRCWSTLRFFDVRLWSVLVLVGCRSALPSCAPPRAEQAPAAPASAGPPEVNVDQALAVLPRGDAGTSQAQVQWLDLVRAERWDEAAMALESLPDAQRNQPTMRLLRARVSMLRDDCAGAVKLLTGLERELTFVAEDIERWRAEAELVSGPYEEAARYFEKQGTAKALAKAAHAQDRAGHADEAKALADRALAAGGLGGEEAPLRALRVRLAEPANQTTTAIEDARWVCVRAPASREAGFAEETLRRLDPAHPLTGKERMSRAERFGEVGRGDDALAELSRAANAPSPPTAEEIDWARAFATYRARGQYDRAAALFDRLASRKGPRQAEALFYAARARSRADHDEEALRGYAAVRRRFPTSPFAEEAAYLTARLMLLHARWSDAATRYAQYLADFRRGRQRDAAAYEYAVVLLVSGQPRRARSELRKLAGATSSPAEGARLKELEGLAAFRSGDRDAAIKVWTAVTSTQPLSWGALTARARLREIKESLPSLIGPSDERQAEPLDVRLPPPAEFYHRLGLDADAEVYLRAHERDAVQSFSGREKQALCMLYDQIGRATRRFRIAQEAVSASVLTRAPSAATEWAWDCLYPRPYATIVDEVETRERLPKGLVYAVMRQESGYDPVVVSPARAVGLLQLLPDTARKVAAEAGAEFDEKLLRVPSSNIDLGARYLSKMLATFDGSVPLAVAAYNAGPHAVSRWLERMPGLDLDIWTALIPYEETRAYVARVMGNLARYAYRQGGESSVPEFDITSPRPTKLETSAY